VRKLFLMTTPLHEFLTANRSEILTRACRQSGVRFTSRATPAELESGLPVFLAQLVGALQRHTEGGEAEIEASATRHGDALLRSGFTVGQVVQDYGGLCQAITVLASERKASISSEEFKTLNACLDQAVAAAVTEYGRRREEIISGQGIEHLGFLAHELRNVLNTATLAFSALQSGIVGIKGNTGGVVGASLTRMRKLLDRSLAEVRLSAGLHQPTRLSVAALIEEVGRAAAIDASHRGLELTVGPVAEDVMIKADAQILVSALSNLLQNAFKFTRPRGHVSMKVHTTGGRVRIDVEDQCGGLPAGTNEDLFRMFEQRGSDRTGLGLGLAISRKGIEDSGGGILVRDLPGEGCVFMVDLPRMP
jgi:hypothetical protein